MHPDYRHLPFLTAACFATILSGCSGGSSTDMSGGDMIPSGVTAESVGFIAGVDRIYASDRTEGIAADDAMTKVVEDTAQTPSGWNLTVDGKSVTYAGSDYGSRASAPHRYFNRFGDEEAWFWSEERDGFDGDRSEFDYLNVYGFVHSDIVSGADLSTVEPTDFERGNFIYIVHGTLTADVPVSGAATYEGRVVAREWSSDSATFTSGSTVLDGRFDMIATFGASETEITGAFSFPNVPGATIPFATSVTGNQLSVSGLSIDEGPFAGYQNIGVRGAFFGPAAEEVGGVFEGDNPGASTLMHGWFAGEQQ